MKQGYIKARMSNDWCLIDFDDGNEELHGSVFVKLQGNPGSIPEEWEVGSRIVLATQDEVLEKMAKSYDQGFHACEKQQEASNVK